MNLHFFDDAACVAVFIPVPFSIKGLVPKISVKNVFNFDYEKYLITQYYFAHY